MKKNKGILQSFVFHRKKDEEFGRFFDETYKIWETKWTKTPVELAKIILPSQKLPAQGNVLIKLHHKYPNAVGCGKASEYFADWKKSSFWGDLFDNSIGERCDFNHKIAIYARNVDTQFEFIYEIK